MFDRHWVGDVGLAVLLAVPTVALSKPQAPATDHPVASAPLVEQAALADQSPADKRFTMSG
jgi:hypothetical protein